MTYPPAIHLVQALRLVERVGFRVRGLHLVYGERPTETMFWWGTLVSFAIWCFES